MKSSSSTRFPQVVHHQVIGYTSYLFPIVVVIHIRNMQGIVKYYMPLI